jgi:cytochrome c oxidase cbb3-type subunit III
MATTEATEKIPMFWLGVLGVLGGLVFSAEDAMRMPRPRLAMAILVAAGLWGSPLAAQPRPQAAADVEDGQRLFVGSCANCHGPDGDGVPGVELARGQFRRASSDSELVDIIRRGLPGTAMPPGNYSNTQATQIVAYLRSLAVSTAQKSTVAGDALRGQTLFAGKGQCLTCHAVNGSGSRLGPDLSDVGQLRRVSDLERALLEPGGDVRPQNRTVRAVTRDGTIITGRLLNHDTFTLLMLDSKEQLRALSKANLREMTFIKTSSKTSYRDKLSSQEIADLVSYLTSLKGVKAVTP